MEKSSQDIKSPNSFPEPILLMNSFIIVLICDNVFNIAHWQNALTFFG